MSLKQIEPEHNTQGSSGKSSKTEADYTVIEENSHMIEVDDNEKSLCTACGERFAPDKLVGLHCGDAYCGGCLESMFTEAMKDETAYPPRCCGTIPLKVAQKHLPKPLVRQFQARQLELSTKNKTYCHKPRCSVFIAPHSIHNDEAVCQECSARTCTKCRANAHFGPCSGGDDSAFMEFAESKHWKRCPQCRRMVERSDGCSQMICRCGFEFCYGCGNRFDDSTRKTMPMAVPYGCECHLSDEVDVFEEDSDEEDDADADGTIRPPGVTIL